MEHLTAEETEAFIEGCLDRKDRERILEHLDHCPLCVKWLADVGGKRSLRPGIAGFAAEGELSKGGLFPVTARRASRGVRAAGVFFSSTWERPARFSAIPST